MDNKSNGKLLALAAGGALLMGSLFFGLSFITGYEVPAPNISAILTPLKSFGGWIALICFASLVIMGLGKMSARINDKWFLSFPLTIIIIVAAMFGSVWLLPNGLVGRTESGRTTLKDGTYIRSVDEWTAFLAKPVYSPNVPLAPPGFDFNGAKALWEQRCNKCHTQASTMDVLRTKYKKTGKIDIIVTRMLQQPGSGITPEDGAIIMKYLNEKL